MKRSFLNFKILAMAASAFSLVACTGAPQVQTNETPLDSDAAAAESSIAVEKSANENSAESQTAVAPAVQSASKPAASSAAPASSSAATSSGSTAAAKPAASAEQASQPAKPAANQNAAQEAAVVNPYQDIPNMVESVFKHTYSLWEQGMNDSAASYLEQFRVIKPLWNQWQAKADSLREIIGQAQMAYAQQFDAQVAEIRNMNRAKAAYSMVAEAADSLIAKNPGDSLITWAQSQKKEAYKNTLEKAQKEKPEIIALAEEKAQFDDALKKAQEFQMRYRDFEEALQISQMIAHIEKLKTDIHSDDQKYWEKNDPKAALAQVDPLIAKKDYKKATELVNKLKASTLRQEAFQKYQNIADSYCNDVRKAGSQLFEKSQKQKDVKKKKAMLQEAINTLTKCIEEYPDYGKAKTVTDNINFLSKEMDR